METLDKKKWKNRVTMFRTASLMAGMALMYMMPAVMADPGENDGKTALKVVFAIIFNIALIVGIIMVGHGGMILIMGHAEQQSPEQARSIREVAAGVVLILIKLIIPVNTLVDLFTVFTESNVGG